MQYLREYINGINENMRLFEGGNIWDDVQTNFDPSQVGKPLSATTQKYLDPLGVKLEVIGSCWQPRYDKDGNVVPSNDLDSMVEQSTLMKNFNTKIIPYPIKTNLWTIKNKNECKKILKLEIKKFKKKLGLFVEIILIHILLLYQKALEE